jgi:hypothetical protein
MPSAVGRTKGKTPCINTKNKIAPSANTEKKDTALNRYLKN